MARSSVAHELLIDGTMRAKLLFALAPLAAFACGSEPVVSPLEVPLEGSYDLTIGSSVARTLEGSGGPDPDPNAYSPSAGAHLRLDLRRANGGYEAVVTPAYGQAAAMQVAVQHGQIVLSGSVQISAGTSPNVSDSWKSLTIPVTSTGLSGPVSMTGNESVFEGDVGWMYTTAAGAVVLHDHSAPEFRLASSGSAAGKFMPWDRLVVEASEPVAFSRWSKATQVSVGTSTGVLAAGTIPPGTEWSGATTLVASFDDFAVGGGSGKIVLQPGVPDLAGNASAPSMQPQTLPFEMVELGAVRSSLDFEKNEVAPALWGNGALVSGAECESGGACARLGTFSTSYCDATEDGIAARLTAPSAKRLAFRLRVHVSAKYEGMTLDPMGGSVLQAVVARSGAARAEKNVAMPKLVQVGSNSAWDSGWTDAHVDLPSGAANVAFALRPTSLFPYGCGGPAPVPADVDVFVDAIHLE